MNPLPRFTRAYPSQLLCCPWCGDDADNVAVTLSQLREAQTDGVLARPPRQPDDTARPGTVEADCRQCRRPFMVGLRESGEMVLIPVRTDKDVALDGGWR